MYTEEPLYFMKFKGELYERLDGHAEQIARVSEEIIEIKERLDGHTDQIAHVSEQVTELRVLLSEKADKKDVIDLKRRVIALES